MILSLCQNHTCFYWCISDFQCCDSLCYTAKWLSFTHIYISFFNIRFHYGLSQETGYSSSRCTVGVCVGIHSKCNSLHLPTPNSQSIPLCPQSLFLMKVKSHLLFSILSFAPLLFHISKLQNILWFSVSVSVKQCIVHHGAIVELNHWTKPEDWQV